MRRAVLFGLVTAVVLVAAGSAFVASRMTTDDGTTTTRLDTADIEVPSAARVDIRVFTQGADLGAPIRFSGEGAFDRDAGVSEVDFDTGDVLNAAGFWGAVDELGAAYQGAELYVTLPDPRLEDRGIRWVSFDADGMGESFSDIGVIPNIARANPLVIMALIDHAPVTPSPESPEEGGLDRFDGPIDLEGALEDVDEQQRPWLQRLIDDGVQDTQVELFVDEDGLLRQVNLMSKVPEVPGSTDLLNQRITIELSPTGEVEVEAPSSEDVVPFDDLIEGAETNS